MIRLEGPTLPKQTQGQIVPALWGDQFIDVPGLPLQVSKTAILAENCGILATDPSPITFEVSGPDIIEILTNLDLSDGINDIVQIDQEWFLVSSVNLDPTTITATRAYGGTIAADHAKGATVIFLEPRELYVFAWCPPGLRYPDDALIQLRVNDGTQTPPCTVRLQDTRIIAGERFVTAEFDTSRYFGGVQQAASFSTVTTPPKQSPPLAGVVFQPYYSTLIGLNGQPYSSGVLISGPPKPSGAQLAGVLPQAPALPPPPPTPSPSVSGQKGPTVSSSVNWQTGGGIGKVTADLKGLIDTTDGRYSGTAELPLIEPATITKARLETLFGETNWHLPSFDTIRETHTLIVMGGLQWRIMDYGEAFPAFRLNTGLSSDADLWLDDEGRWHFTSFNERVPAVATITEREIFGELSLGFIAPTATQLPVDWGDRSQSGTFTIDSPTMQERFDIIDDRQLRLLYVADEIAAKRIAYRWLPRWDRPKATATFAVAHALGALTRTDPVMIDVPIINTYGRNRQPWYIRGTTDRGDQRVLVAVEGDPSAYALQAQFAMLASESYSLSAEFAIDANFLFLDATFEIANAVSAYGDAYFGPQYFGNAYFG